MMFYIRNTKLIKSIQKFYSDDIYKLQIIPSMPKSRSEVGDLRPVGQHLACEENFLALEAIKYYNFV